MKVRLKRVYETFEDDDGFRVLVDRLWPRGMKKEDIKLDYWASDLAPTNELRKWFGHDVKKWNEFKKRYMNELEGNSEYVHELLCMSDKSILTLLYSAKNRDYNQAVVLKKFIEDMILKTTDTG